MNRKRNISLDDQVLEIKSRLATLESDPDYQIKDYAAQLELFKD